MADANEADLTALTVQLLSAYVSNNQVPSGELAGLIQTTRAALAPDVAPVAAPDAEHQPAVTVRKSLASREHIISLIDGRPYKSLKRHLSAHGLSPAQYRERYKLAKDYPMVAPGYSEQRREVAKRLGLGRKPAMGTAAPQARAAEAVPEQDAAPAGPVAPAKAPRAKLKIAIPPAATTGEAAPQTAKKGAGSKTKAGPASKAGAASTPDAGPGGAAALAADKPRRGGKAAAPAPRAEG